MKLTLKREELVALNVILMQISENKNKESYDKRFIFGVHRNLENFESEIKALQETQKEPERIQEFQEKMQKIGQECAEKDENGKAKLTPKNGAEVFVIVEKLTEAQERTIKLREEYKDVIEQQQENMNQFNELMKEDVETEICKISFNYFPDKYDINIHKILKHIIKETDEEIEAML